MLRVNAEFLKYGEKISIFKNTQIRVDGALEEQWVYALQAKVTVALFYASLKYLLSLP